MQTSSPNEVLGLFCCLGESMHVSRMLALVHNRIFGGYENCQQLRMSNATVQLSWWGLAGWDFTQAKAPYVLKSTQLLCYSGS